MVKTLIFAAAVVVISVVLILVLGGCSDASWSQISSIGSPGKVICYSGGKVIYEGTSTGKIATEQGSDGWFFKEVGSGNLIRVSGDCLIRN